MNKIETTLWKDFSLDSLFIITGSTTTPKNALELDEDKPYPYVTTAATNNGIFGYSDIYTEEGNVLTVDSAVLGYCFYQEKNFTASDHVEKLIPKFKMTKRIGLYIVSIMNGMSKTLGYAYNEKRSQTALKKEQIRLPVDNNGEPDRDYMENYIKEIEDKSKEKLKNLKSLRGGVN